MENIEKINSLNIDCNIKYKKNKFVNGLFKRKKYIYDSFFINRYFYFTLFVCLIIIYLKDFKYIYRWDHSKYIFILFSSLALVSFWGWYVHYLSHYLCFVDFYKKCNKEFFNRKTDTTFDHILIQIFTYVFDFHDTIHHNSNINKQWINLIGEFIGNFWYEGLSLYFLFYILNIKDLINFSVLFLWALTYASAHVINYYFENPLCHTQHHLNPKTNFGIDTMDVIMGTKYDLNCLENFNHVSINLIVITFIIYYFNI